MNEISPIEVDFHPLSFADPTGRLFRWNGDLYRGISGERAELYRKLFDGNVLQPLVDKGLLIHTEPSSLALNTFSLVVRHRELPFVSYPHEWCAAMLKEAALTVLDTQIELTKHGLTLEDAHPWNVVFDGTKGIWVDFGSIKRGDSSCLWVGYEEFCRFFIHPLQLMVRGHGRIARWLLHDYDLGVLRSEVIALSGSPALKLRYESAVSNTRARYNRVLSRIKQRVPTSFRPRLKNTVAKIKSLVPPNGFTTDDRLRFLARERKKIEDVPVGPVKTDWTEYYEGEFPPFTPSDEWQAKHHSIYNTLVAFHPTSVLDIGSNRGWYSQMAAILGSSVVAFDVDDSTVTQLYLDAKQKNLPILPLIMDFRNPSPGYGLCNQWLAPANDRFQCDMVLALALVHHLVFKQSLNFDQIIEGLLFFSSRWLVVEFIPREDRYVSEWWSEKFGWYTLEAFMTALEKRFRAVKLLPSHPHPRVLLVCEK